MLHGRFNPGCSACLKEKRRVEQDHRTSARILKLLKENGELRDKTRRLEEENQKLRKLLGPSA